MTEEQYEDEITRLEDLCDRYELLWRRAADGAASANKGIRRLTERAERLERERDQAVEQLGYTQLLLDRAALANAEAEKKVQRLSLKILDLWSRE